MGTCLSIYEQTIWPIGIASEPLAMRVIAPRERWNYELLGATVTMKIRVMLMEPGGERSISWGAT